jgi:hypothetical protein
MAVVFVSGTPVKTKNVVYKEETMKHGETETELGYQTEELIVSLCSIFTINLLYKKYISVNIKQYNKPLSVLE